MTMEEFEYYIDGKNQRIEIDRKQFDSGIARLMCLYVNSNIPKGKKKTKPTDFMPKYSGSKSAEQMINLLKAITVINGGKVWQQSEK